MHPRHPDWRRAEARVARLVLALALVVCPARAAQAGGAGNGVPTPPKRIVAVGDIHGAFNGVREILRKVEVIDQRDRWVAGDTILVQTGDFLDRGPGATKVAELLMALQQEAPKHGGEVIVLLGNHEILNLLGDLRDVTKYIFRNLVDGRSEKRLTVSCNGYAAFYRRLYELRREKPPKRRELIEQCLSEQQLGLVEYLEAVSPRGKIGRWLRKLPAVAKVGDVVFVHGGISPALADTDLNEINRDVQREIHSFDVTREYLIGQGLILPTTRLAGILSMSRQLAKATSGAPSQPPLSAELLHVLQFDEWLAVRDDGPLWFRGYALWSEDEGEAQISAILDRYQAEHVVVGAHAAAALPHPAALRRPGFPDRHRHTDELLQRPTERARNPGRHVHRLLPDPAEPALRIAGGGADPVDPQG